MNHQKNFCPGWSVVVSRYDDLSRKTTAELAETMTDAKDDLWSVVLHGALAAVIIFVMIVMVMLEIGNYPEYPEGAPRPVRAAFLLPEQYSIEGAHPDIHVGNGPPRHEETLWK